jgi:hypothetical protein
MFDFSFVEYSYNPNTISADQIRSQLKLLGFVHRTQHRNNSVGFWVQNNCILLVREHQHQLVPGISGIGFIADCEDFLPDTVKDPDSDICCKVVNGMRLLFVPATQMITLMTNNFETVDNSPYKMQGLEYISAVMYNMDVTSEEEFKVLGFTNSKSSDTLRSIASKNKRLSIIINNSFNVDKRTIYIDTADLFYAAACLELAGVSSKSSTGSNVPDGFGNLAHKIVGYQCSAAGNSNSYSIEKFYPDVLPNTDLILRMRKQYININEQALLSYYNEQP